MVQHFLCSLSPRTTLRWTIPWPLVLHRCSPLMLSRIGVRAIRLNIIYLRIIINFWLGNTWIPLRSKRVSSKIDRILIYYHNIFLPSLFLGSCSGRSLSLMEALSRAGPLDSSDIGALSHDIRSRPRRNWPPIVHISHLVTLSLELICRLILKLLATACTRADRLGFILLTSAFDWFTSLGGSNYSSHGFRVIYYKVIDIICIIAKLKRNDVSLTGLNYLHRLLLFIIDNNIGLLLLCFGLICLILIVILNEIITAFDHTLLLLLNHLLSNLFGALVLFLCLSRQLSIFFNS